MKLYPLLLEPVTKSPIWGGTRLLTEWGVRSEAPTVGEAWVLSVRKAEQNRIANGVFAGKRIGEVIGEYGAPETDFPLLVKLLDAKENLSVQVHPDDAYAARVENDRGKTEMWHILEAEPDSELIMGLRKGVSGKDFARAVQEGKTESVLNHIRVHAGETYFIPAGMPHAIGKGILLAEIQQNCDLTYRIWDYNRLGKDGKPRELHIEKAMDVVRPFSAEEIDTLRYKSNPKADRTAFLAACPQFCVQRLNISAQTSLPAADGICHLLCIAGQGQLICNGESYPVLRGSSWLLPPKTEVLASGEMTILLSRP